MSKKEGRRAVLEKSQETDPGMSRNVTPSRQDKKCQRRNTDQYMTMGELANPVTKRGLLFSTIHKSSF